MTIGEWLTVLGAIFGGTTTVLAFAYRVLKSDLRAFIKDLFSEFREELQTEKIRDLMRDNERLQKRVDDTK